MAKKPKQEDSALISDQQEKTVKAVKAFNHDFSCRGFQFEVGKEYKISSKIVVCRNGFHAVSLDNPFHAWDFYPLVDGNGRLTRYADVTQSGSMQDEKTGKGMKIASAKISIDAEISLPSFIKRGVEAILLSIKFASGNGSTQAASGNGSTQAASGNGSTQAASGDYSKQAASGYDSKQAASGNGSTQAASGDYSKQAASGNGSTQAASGDGSTQAASGNGSTQAASGYGSTFEITGQNGVIACSGRDGTAKGAIGTWISLAEYDDSGKCIGFAVGCIGTDGLELGVPYIAKGGKLVKKN